MMFSLKGYTMAAAAAAAAKAAAAGCRTHARILAR